MMASAELLPGLLCTTLTGPRGVCGIDWARDLSPALLITLASPWATDATAASYVRVAVLSASTSMFSALIAAMSARASCCLWLSAACPAVTAFWRMVSAFAAIGEACTSAHCAPALHTASRLVNDAATVSPLVRVLFTLAWVLGFDMGHLSSRAQLIRSGPRRIRGPWVTP